MKRQGDNIIGQPSMKKSDNVSTDLRSKISAKLQTLLNGIASNSRILNRRQYDNLFSESDHPEIIIDPTIVVKTEVSSTENCNEAQNLQSENFLHSAKSRLTELLKKTQEENGKNSYDYSEKEDLLSVNDCDSPTKFETFNVEACNQNLYSYSLLNEKETSNSELSNEFNCDILISHEQLNPRVVLEDCIKCKDRTCSSSGLTNETTENFTLNSLISAKERDNIVSNFNTLDESVHFYCDSGDSADKIVSTLNSHIPPVEQLTINVNANSSKENTVINSTSVTATFFGSKPKSKVTLDVIDLDGVLISESNNSEQNALTINENPNYSKENTNVMNSMSNKSKLFRSKQPSKVPFDVVDLGDILISETNNSEQNSLLNPSSSKENTDVINSKSMNHKSFKSNSKSNVPCDVIDLDDYENNNSEPITITDDEDSEIDDPRVGANSISQSRLTGEDDTDVVVLCEKQPTYEVITLEDAEDDGIVDVTCETLYPCHQCEKIFRAKFLLNFHLRMHEIDSRDSEVPVSNLSTANCLDDK